MSTFIDLRDNIANGETILRPNDNRQNGKNSITTLFKHCLSKHGDGVTVSSPSGLLELSEKKSDMRSVAVQLGWNFGRKRFPSNCLHIFELTAITFLKFKETNPTFDCLHSGQRGLNVCNWSLRDFLLMQGFCSQRDLA